MATPAPAPEISIVVPAYNEERFLPACLGALTSSIREISAAAELIVADDGSTDRTADIARAHGARVIAAGARNIAAARNAGAAAAQGRWLLFVDADTQVDGVLLARTLAAFRTHRVVGGGAEVELDDADALDVSAALSFKAWNRMAHLLGWAAGSYLFCRRDAFRGVRGFDARFFVSEELDLSQRLARWGRARQMRFAFLSGTPYRTSARKFRETSAWEMISVFARLVLSRERLHRRADCSLWYEVKR